jgi:hypothetical protein
VRRDLYLIRQILLALEDGSFRDFEIEGRDPVDVGYHAYLIADAGLAVGHDATALWRSRPEGLPAHLTWAGHDFIDAARND